MSYRLIDANEIAMQCPEVNDMPCIYADLDDGLDGSYYDLRCDRTLQAENAKLRELVSDMWPHVRHRSRMCGECELPCDTSDECLLYEPMRQCMRELGIEVDAWM